MVICLSSHLADIHDQLDAEITEKHQKKLIDRVTDVLVHAV